MEAMAEMAHGANLSFRIDQGSLPVPAVVERFSLAFGFDPIRMISSGALVVTLPQGVVEQARAELQGIAPLYPCRRG